MRKKMAILGIVAGLMVVSAAVSCAAEEHVEMAGAYEEYEEAGMTEDAQKAFDDAMAKYENGKNYKALQLVETQVVAGMNYRIVCEAEQNDAAPQKVILTIYRDLDGNSEVTMEQKIVAPINQQMTTVDQDFSSRVSFQADSFDWEKHTLHFDIYQDTRYDMVEMTNMEIGTVIEVEGRYVTVESMEEGEAVRRTSEGDEERAATLTINKDQADENYFIADEGGTWIASLPDDLVDIVKVGEAELPFTEKLSFTDMTDNPGESKVVPFEELQNYMEGNEASGHGFYDAYSTRIEVQNGEIVSIVRTWRP